MSRVWPACIALLVAVCGGYFALVPFLRALEPAPEFGAAATVSAPASSVAVASVAPVQSSRQLVSNTLRPHPKKPVHKANKVKQVKKPVHKTVTTVPTRPVFVNHALRPHPTTTTRHAAAPAAPSQPSRPVAKQPVAKQRPVAKKQPVAPARSRGSVVGTTNTQGSGLAARGGSSDSTVSGGVSSSPARP